MLTKSVTLKFYKKKDIQQAMVDHAHHKEIGMRYHESFGKRPDILSYPRDVLELALKGATSFHASEEIWENPLHLHSNLSKKELDSLRIGWDLVLDIDCPDWEVSKITAHLFIKALQDNLVKDITCKFSGNKGFHIGVPFEAFPKEVAGKKIQELFPEAPKKIALYLLNYITSHYIAVADDTVFFDRFSFTISHLKEKFGDRHFLAHKCAVCQKKVVLTVEEVNEFICARCEQVIKDNADFLSCPKCSILMEKMGDRKSLCSCGSSKYWTSFDPLSILDIDTVLISSRHLYRMPYSLHEKSGLVSLPIDPAKVIEFDKSLAEPEKVIRLSGLSPPFLYRQVGESARHLLAQALDFDVKIEDDHEPRPYEDIIITSPITEEYFPDCMKKILQGMEDGKKRGLFCLINFLGKIGWSKQDIENRVTLWNKENREPLRDVYVKSQLHHVKPGERLPPNCNNDAYYKDLGLQCANCRFKNPVNYTLWRWRRMMQDKE